MSRDCEAAMSKPRSGVPVVLAESRKQDTFQKHGLVPDSVNNPDCELVAG